jgi:hypothetical protein
MTHHLTISSDEAIYILGAIARVNDNHRFSTDFATNLMKKLGCSMTVGELHDAEQQYRNITFSEPANSLLPSFVETFHADYR